MNEKYSPKDIEKYVQNHWEKNHTFKTTEDTSKKKYYCLVMLPYPSGKLHIGHVRNYTIGDVIARYQRMLRKNVLHPIGWDAFGLPAENAALENNIDPETWTRKNIIYMKSQLKKLGFSYDWSREFTTCNPTYYRWEQWFFIQLYKKGLAYKKLSKVHWCPKDRTVLANEQVVDGRCWRCDTLIKEKKISQWFLKITSYADQLLNDLDLLTTWPKKVINMQRNWIGRSEGFEIIFNIKEMKKKIYIFTTSPEKIVGVTYLIIGLNHFLIKKLLLNKKIENFVNESYKNNLSKNILTIGINTGLFAEHPITHELLPIWIGNFVINENKNGAMMGVPTENVSDLDFATKHKINIKPIFFTNKIKKINVDTIAIDNKKKLFNFEKFHHISPTEKIKFIKNFLEKNKIGKKKIYYKLKDWGISRQRYWGAPIPMLTFQNGIIIPEKEKNLPVILHKRIKKNTDNSIQIHTKVEKIYIKNEIATREKDTFDTFIESSWYYARYTCPNYDQGMLKVSSVNYWLPVDQYIGGIEHSILHLMYFRFFHKLLRDFGLVQSDEPVKRLLCQGMVLSETFYIQHDNGKKEWISYAEVDITRDKHGKIKELKNTQGKKVIYAGLKKMSKSKKNGIDPEKIIEHYGADTLRLFIIFSAPISLPLVWNITGIEGSYRFLKKFWKLVFDHIKKGVISKVIIDSHKLNNIQKDIRYFLHKTILKVSDDIDRRQNFNTAISAIMEMTNKLVLFPQNNDQDRMVMQEALIALVQMLHPFTPHTSFVCWEKLGCQGEIDYSTWPKVDHNAIIKNNILLIIQINGKLRGKIHVSIHENKEEIQKKVIKENCILKYIKNKNILKIIYIHRKLINLVTD